MPTMMGPGGQRRAGHVGMIGARGRRPIGTGPQAGAGHYGSPESEPDEVDLAHHALWRRGGARADDEVADLRVRKGLQRLARGRTLRDVRHVLGDR